MADKALKLVNGVPRMVSVPAAIYEEDVVAGVGGISAGANVTLPNSQTYTDTDLKVFLDGMFLEPLVDYNYVGSGSGKTQIQMVIEVLEGERLKFRIESA